MTRALARSSVRALAAALAVVALASPAAAAPYDGTRVAPATPVTVTVALRPSDPAGLARAAAESGAASASQRRAALARVAPARESRQRVVAHLRDHGFTVVSETASTISARGTAGRALSAFGVRLQASGRGVRPAGRAVVPAALRPDVLAVSGLDTTPAWSRRAIPAIGGHTGPTLAAAYRNSSMHNGVGAGMTIASVQFSGWRSADLRTYASAAGIPLPTGHISEVPINGYDTTTTGDGGEFEVALDQEVLLATAPAARQRIYFGYNSMGEAIALYGRIAQDVATYGIDVVTTSWGMCEAAADASPEQRLALETQFQNILAAGATIFAASGDLGAYGCWSDAAPQHTEVVDFPASSPHVVGVGGTKLARSGTGWSESGWVDPDSNTGDAFAGFASGGGFSASVARPAWQAGIGPGGDYRLVPDVAAVAAPSHGFTTYSLSVGGWVLGGGTSAAAPIWAGQLAAMLSRAGRTEGLGAIHARLYRARATFTDITSGHNFAYSAGPGYDLVTGLGSPRWDRLAAPLLGDPAVSAPGATRTLTFPIRVTDPAGSGFTSYWAGEGSRWCSGGGASATPPTSVTIGAGANRAATISVAALDSSGVCHVVKRTVVYDTVAPVVRASVRPVAADARTVFSWPATDARPSGGVSRYSVSITMVGGGSMYSATTTSRSVTLTLRQGWTYLLKANATDVAGNRGGTAQYTYTVPLDELALSRSSGWSRLVTTAAWYGSHTRSATRGASMSKALVGRRYDVLFTSTTASGYVDVYIDGRFVRRVDTYASGTLYRRYVTVANYSTRAARTITLRVVGTRNRSSRGNYVYIDAIRAVA